MKNFVVSICKLLYWTVTIFATFVTWWFAGHYVYGFRIGSTDFNPMVDVVIDIFIAICVAMIPALIVMSICFRMSELLERVIGVNLAGHDHPRSKPTL